MESLCLDFLLPDCLSGTGQLGECIMGIARVCRSILLCPAKLTSWTLEGSARFRRFVVLLVLQYLLFFLILFFLLFLFLFLFLLESVLLLLIFLLTCVGLHLRVDCSPNGH